MIARDTRFAPAYYDERIAYRQQLIAEDEQELAELPSHIINPGSLAYDIVEYRRVLLRAEYSRGYQLENLRTEFAAFITSWENLCRVDKNGLYTITFKDGIDDYSKALGALSQAYMLDVEPALLTRTLACIGNEGEDLLFEALVAAIFPGLTRKPAKKLRFANAYQPLYDATQAPAEQRPALLQQFLKKWYGKMKSAAFYDTHKKPTSGAYSGYWCWEAAGVAVAFGIDDTSFRDMPYYPKDLADFGRAQHSQRSA